MRGVGAVALLTLKVPDAEARTVYGRALVSLTVVGASAWRSKMVRECDGSHATLSR